MQGDENLQETSSRECKLQHVRRKPLKKLNKTNIWESWYKNNLKWGQANHIMLPTKLPECLISSKETSITVLNPPKRTCISPSSNHILNMPLRLGIQALRKTKISSKECSEGLWDLSWGITNQNQVSSRC